MNFGDASPQSIPRFGSVVQWDNPNQLPLGLATTTRNCRYTAQSVGTRWGFTNRMQFGAVSASVSGLCSLRYLGADNSGSEFINLLAYTAVDGNIWSATPYAQGSIAQLSTDALYALANIARVPGLDPRMTQAFNRGYAAMGDLTTGVAAPMVFDPSLSSLDAVSDKPFAFAWAPNTRVRVGQIVSPSTFNTYGLPVANGVWVAQVTGHFYQCTVAGVTAAATQPAWPIQTGAAVGIDGSVQWVEYTPTCGSGLPDPLAPTNPTTAGGDVGSPIIAGATAFVVLTYVSAQGESINDVVTTQGLLDTRKVLEYTNTTGGPVDLSFTLPPIPAELQTSGPLGANGATGYNIYVYIVQGAIDTTKSIDGSFYAQFNASNLPGGTVVTLSTFPTGQTLPTVNSAVIVGEGNVDTGIRWMVVMFETRTRYISGFSISAPIQVNVTQTGLRLLGQKIPIGPYNCIRRLCAFTVAGASSAGPYTYVDQAGVESPGFNQPDVPITSTCIDNNVDTTATFNFTDTYLPGASTVTNYFQRIEVPPCSDIYFSKTLQQVIYTGAKGYPSGHLVSDQGDPEAVRIPGSNIQVSESDGDRTVCWREVRENQISLKENSGHAIIPNSGDPSTWPAQAIWRGAGPVGAKAVAVSVDDDAEFMVFAHRSGPYRYTGGTPQLIGREIQAIWDNINWNYGYLIVVAIDEKNREVRFSVPYGNSTTRNAVITCNYYFGWADPVIFVTRSGRLVPNVNGRKWSVDDILANDMIYIPQRYSTATHGLGGVDLNQNFIKVGPDGVVYTLTPNQYFDQNANFARVGYFSQWQSVPGPNPSLSINQLLGASCSAIGAGLLNLYARDDKNNLYALSSAKRTWPLQPFETQMDFGIVATQASRYGIGFDNGGIAGAWFEMHIANLMIAPTYATRPG